MLKEYHFAWFFNYIKLKDNQEFLYPTFSSLFSNFTDFFVNDLRLEMYSNRDVFQDIYISYFNIDIAFRELYGSLDDEVICIGGIDYV